MKKYKVYFDGSIEIEAESELEAEENFNAITDTESVLEAIQIVEVNEVEGGEEVCHQCGKLQEYNIKHGVKHCSVCDEQME
jgi:hypothetical protein